MKTINQTIEFEASPHEIYELLMDSEKHAKFSGAPAEITREIGMQFKCYDGWIEAENIELVPDKKIVQKWRGKDWKEGHFSKVTFLLEENENSGCRLDFTQTDVPDEVFEHIDKGWHVMYWDKMKNYLKE